MSFRDFGVILGTALFTAVLSFGLFAPTWIDAGGDGVSSAPLVAAPKLTANGIEVSLVRIKKDSTDPGAAPAFRLSATNVTGRPATTTIETAMVTIPVAQPLSRMPRVPRQIWQKRETLTLGPNETATFTEATETKLPVDAQTDVMLRVVTGDVMPVRSGVVVLSIPGSALPKDLASSKSGRPDSPVR